MNCVRKLRLTTCAAPASAASTSPRCTTEVERTLPSGCSCGASAASAAAGLVTGSSTSYSTSTSAAASRAAWRVSAAMQAITSPTYEVVSPTATSWRQSCFSDPSMRRPGTSAAVRTAITPGCASAFAVSMPQDARPRMIGEAQRAVQHSRRSLRSATNGLSPSASSSAR